MADCFLKGHGSCSLKSSKEHYISKTILKALNSNGGFKIGGLPWQPDQTLQIFGIQSLVSKILCQTHNSSLSPLDDVAGKLFRAIDLADKSPATLPSVTQLDGLFIERWFVKVLCGLAATAGLNNGSVPEQWKLLLLRGQWPDHWGLYLPLPSTQQVLAKELYIETMVNPETRDVLAASFRIAGVCFNITLGRPDNPSAWGIHRPRGIIFQTEIGEKCIEFVWPHLTEQAVIYKKVGASKERPPQWDGWKE